MYITYNNFKSYIFICIYSYIYIFIYMYTYIKHLTVIKILEGRCYMIVKK